ncbi:hypothetical protein QYM36_004922 [Artemia franciscana]|uniref:Reverse transcriptase domain-containing protein n=1 Tax=Artemia franciscana TaxID=6661 RepID=A0AA88L5G1_ARTSF|nr:hypothetical protein QYM36_004922 [Artemia franciscana]
MEEVFKGLDIGLIIDDIAGTAANTEDHDAKLRLVLHRAREKGVRFNQDKCILNAESIPYFGHLLTTEGIKPDSEKTKAIGNMPAPESHEQLQVKPDHNAGWQTALILEKYEYAPQSKILQKENGKVYRWNRQQIRERNQSMSTESHFEATSPEPSIPGDQPHVSPRAQIGIEHPHSVSSSPKNFPTPPRPTTTPDERFATPLADAATAESPSRSPSHLTQQPRQLLRATTRSGRITKPLTRLNL